MGKCFAHATGSKTLRPHAVGICKTQSLVPGITHGILSKSKKSMKYRLIVLLEYSELKKETN